MTPEEIRKWADDMDQMPLHIQETHTARLIHALVDVVEAALDLEDLGFSTYRMKQALACLRTLKP